MILIFKELLIDLAVIYFCLSNSISRNFSFSNLINMKCTIESNQLNVNKKKTLQSTFMSMNKIPIIVLKNHPKTTSTF